MQDNEEADENEGQDDYNQEVGKVTTEENDTDGNNGIYESHEDDGVADKEELDRLGV